MPQSVRAMCMTTASPKPHTPMGKLDSKMMKKRPASCAKGTASGPTAIPIISGLFFVEELAGVVGAELTGIWVGEERRRERKGEECESSVRGVRGVEGG